MTQLDTSLLIGALTGARPLAPALRRVGEQGERMLLSSPVLYEWLRGPRHEAELTAQEALFPRESAVPFGPIEAATAADLYRRLRRPRGREIDVAIAACAVAHGAALWTLNPEDFEDVPGLELFRALRA